MYKFLHKNYISKPYDLDQDIPTNLVPWSFKLYQYQITISTSILFSKHYILMGHHDWIQWGTGDLWNINTKFLIWLDIIAYMKKGVGQGVKCGPSTQTPMDWRPWCTFEVDINSWLSPHLIFEWPSYECWHALLHFSIQWQIEKIHENFIAIGIENLYDMWVKFTCKHVNFGPTISTQTWTN